MVDINKFSKEQIDYMYSDEEFIVFINHYFSSFNTCIQKANFARSIGNLDIRDIDVYLRIVLANLSELRNLIVKMDKNLSYSYLENDKEIAGGIQGRLQVNKYARNKVKRTTPKVYPCVIRGKSLVTVENVYLIYIVDYVLNLLAELKKYIFENKRKASISELIQIEDYTREFERFTRKGYFLECAKELSIIKKQYGGVFPSDKYTLLLNRLRKGKVRNAYAYTEIFKWYDNLKEGSLIFVSDSTMDMLRYSDEFANKLFELWCLYSIKKTFVKDFMSEVIEENDIMGSNSDYIYKLSTVTGGILEIFFQKGSQLYWNNQEELTWKYKKDEGVQGLIGIPDISIKYKSFRESLIMIDVKNRIRNEGQCSEEIYKMIGYFSNFKKAFNYYGDDVKRQAALIFRNDMKPINDFLESDEGCLIQLISVSPLQDEELNSNQFKVLCKYVLNTQGMDGVTSELFGDYSFGAKRFVTDTLNKDTDEEEIAYRLSEMNHQNFLSKFMYGELSESLNNSLETIRCNYFPHIWENLDNDAKSILGMAECLFEGVTKCNEADYAPFCLEYCRALEVQINALIFHPFKLSYDIQKLAARNRFYEKLLENRPLTLGECLYCFERCSHKRYPMTELKKYCDSIIMQADLFFNVSVAAMKKVNEQVRRKAAHTEVMSYEELVDTRQRILGIGNNNLFYTMLDKR